MIKHKIFRGRREIGGLSPLERGYALGDGIFETIKVVGGNATWLDEHLERMYSSAKFVGITVEFLKNEISEICRHFISEGGIADGFIRLTLSRGETTTGRFSDMPEAATLSIVGGNAEVGHLPLKVGLAEWPLNEKDPAVRHKTISKISSVLAWKSAREKGFDELLFQNTKGIVAEGIVSNVFWFMGDVLYTPSEECGILPGVARKTVLSAAKKLGISCSVGEFVVTEPQTADGLFFTNSLWIIRECGEFNGVAFNRNNPRIKALRECVINDQGEI